MKFPLALTVLAGLLAPATAATNTTAKCTLSKTSEAYCDGTNYNASLTTEYVCGDFRLGPPKLPEKLPLDSVFTIYERFGGLCPGPFLAAWFNTTTGWWNYPSFAGFSVANDGAPIQGNITLAPGTLIDRFGSEYGTYVSPAAAPYLQRALPPSNLNTPQDAPAFPYNYRVYRVTKDLVVLAGPILPWFGQPGQGVQYMLYNNLATLTSQGFVERVDPAVMLARR
ncbi:hypothetical protein B0H67DRAFT_566612 [Lasiosphaeris hirsuta]|uniref:TNT domain-containing protein n=1 Tax=Lasiosphaeris hirsuta TaxID=260670 RepID=A0AA40BD53_9PEZI|nr:hypothetical protein B0H67DRAFT_566612 [Lasiosphaeris hirsuta]